MEWKIAEGILIAAAVITVANVLVDCIASELWGSTEDR